MTSARPISANSTTGRRRIPGVIAAFVAVCLTLAGLTAQPAQAADTGSITGQIFTQAVTGSKAAATDSFIYLYRQAPGGYYESVDRIPSTPGTDGYSFAGSTFGLTGLAPGTYKFEVAGVSSSDPTDYQREHYNDAEHLSDADPIQVGTGPVAVDDMVLEPAGQITGRVTDADGNPIANASVMFERTRAGGGNGTQTDANGYYTSETDVAEGFGAGLVRGDVRVSASKYGSSLTPDAPSYEQEYWKQASTFDTATAVTVTPGGTAINIDFTLEQSPRVRLTVKDSGGAPLPNVGVGVWHFDNGVWGLYRAGPNMTDGEGIYRKDVRIGERFKFFIAQPSGGTKWYGNTYDEATATEISASTHGQVLDLTLQLDPAPAAAPRKALQAKKVSIKGTAKVGKKLRASTSAWGPSPVRKSYKWYRNGRAISGQKNSTYKLRKADVGKRITVRVTQKKSSYVSANKLSAKTKKVKKK